MTNLWQPVKKVIMHKLTAASFIYPNKNLALISFLIVLSLLCFSFSGYAEQVDAYLTSTKTKPGIFLKFDKQPHEELPRNIPLTVQGGTHVPQGISGRSWKFNSGEFLNFDTNNKLNPSEGTILLWVRPHWQNDDLNSHTLLSLTWSGQDGAYLALSRGWWEPAGARRTYFILNNQDHAHVSKPIEYEPNTWTHLACTWKAGNPGFLRLYVNGFKAAENKYTMKAERQPSTPLYVGTDQGTPLAKNRWAGSDLDDLAVYSTALTDEEIFAIFDKLKPPPPRRLQEINGQILETRAIFDGGTGWSTEGGARKTIERVKKAGFNVYVPCVWIGTGTYYPSSKAPPAPGFTIITTDPLKRLIDIAHQNGIEVHPWFCVALRQRDFFPEFFGPGTPERAFDLHRPAFRKFIVELILDVIQRYDVQGINLDFIRTMGLCRCEFCQQEYRRTTGRDLLADINSSKPGTSLPSLQKWQDDAVEDIVRQVKEKGKAIKPRLIISVCGYPMTTPNPEGREEISWANAGLIDLIFNMDYQYIPDFERQQVLRNRLKEPDKLVMLLANYQWDRVQKKHLITDPAHLVRLIDNLRYRWPGAVGIYIYSLLNDAQVEKLSQGVFSLPARPFWRKY